MHVQEIATSLATLLPRDDNEEAHLNFDTASAKLRVVERDSPLLRVFLFPIEDGDVADDAGDLAAGAQGDFRCQEFFGVFVFIESDLDEFADLERVIYRPDHGVCHAVLANEDDRLKAVGQAA